MRHKKIVVAILLTVMAIISGIMIFNISYNAVFYKINHYICEQYSIVKYVKFKNYCFSSYPGCDFDIYVDPNCTPEQAKDIFEDFVTYFSDELINRLHNEMEGKVFLDVDFTNVETDLRMYYFETDDIEKFVHWRMMSEYGEDMDYTFDRHINLPVTTKYILSYPMVKKYDGDNDGLMALTSAEWGERFTLIYPKGKKGL